ncbi:hypothetical protein [Pseudomonas fluorescens]|uniref:Uncharacterized protein n=1 Tax=Pseudomonas fluorescens TaxID=294 RepID=A0A5E7BET4_PSEFL|nr:hypothetical protein [Pseudomonas fluorescens]VVN89975.1 hypothetical protein PS691_01787 [Pseudomonas fluorescens]
MNLAKYFSISKMILVQILAHKYLEAPEGKEVVAAAVGAAVEVDVAVEVVAAMAVVAEALGEPEVGELVADVQIHEFISSFSRRYR